MAVPQAARERAQREEADLRARGIDPNGPPPGVSAEPTPAPAPVQPPTLAAVPAPTDEMAALRARNAELEQELRTQSGRASSTSSEVADLKARFELINSNRAFLESSVTEMTAKNQELEARIAELQTQGTTAQVHAVVGSLDGEGPTAEQLKDYGDSLDFIQRVVKQQLAAVVKPLVAEIAEIKKQLGQVKEFGAKLPKLEETARVTEINHARMKEEEFLRTEVIPYFKDFETVRTTPEWKAYLGQDTGRGYVVGHLLKTYRQTNDAVGIRTVIGAFYDKRNAKPSLDSLAVPAKSAADAPETPAPVKLKASEYKKNLKDFTMKRMSKQDWEAYRAKWDQAIQAGNVEMDTDIR